MIVSFFAHPVAFLFGFLAAMAYGELAGYPEDSWWPVGIFVVVYLIGSWVLPWWTRPLSLWRYWRLKRNPPHDPSLPPWAQRKG